jgi:hypothetical protein
MRILLFAVCISSGMVGIAHAVVLIDQKFDDTSVFVNESQLGLPGTGDSSTTAGLWRQGLSAPGGSVANAQSYSGAQSISTVRTTFGKGQVLGFVNDGATSGMVETSFRFRKASDPNSGASFRLGYSNDIAVFDNIDLGVEINGDNSVFVVDGGSPVPVIAQVDADPANPTWHAFKLVVDVTAKKYDVYYSADATDANFAAVYIGATVPTIFSDGGKVNCMWWGPNFDGHTVYIDDAYLTADAIVPPSLTGDYNSNGVVDAADYVVWRKSNGTANALPNDPIGGTIGTDQYNQWRSHFGNSSGGGAVLSSAIPEPTTSSIFGVGILAMTLAKHRPHKRLRVKA